MRFILLTTLLLAGGLYLHRLHHVDRVIASVARDSGVDADLLSAVAWQESRYDPEAVGKAGEVGMFQIMPSTAGDWAKAKGRQKLSDAELQVLRQNAVVAAWYLKQGLEVYKDKDDPRPYALARYNAGPSRVRKWEVGKSDAKAFVDGIGIKSTQKYVRNVMQRIGVWASSSDNKKE